MMAPSASSARSSSGTSTSTSSNPARRQPLERLLDSSPHLWTNIRILELPPQHAHPQPVDRSEANRSTGEHAQEGRRLLDRPRQRAHVIARGREREDPVDRHEPERGLEADDAAVRGGDANRAARVRAEGVVADAGGDECRRAAARTPRRAARVERVERHPVGRVDAAGRVLQQVRLAEKLGPRRS